MSSEWIGITVPISWSLVKMNGKSFKRIVHMEYSWEQIGNMRDFKFVMKQDRKITWRKNISSHDFLPNTSIFATTIDGELIDVINIKDSFNRLPQEEKLKIVSVLLEFCAMETCNLINQNK